MSPKGGSKGCNEARTLATKPVLVHRPLRKKSESFFFTSINAYNKPF